MRRTVALAFLLAGCADRPAMTQDGFDAWFRSLQGLHEGIVVAAIGEKPRQVVKPEDGRKVLRWWWTIPEVCFATWTIEGGYAVDYRWEGPGCRATAKTHGSKL